MTIGRREVLQSGGGAQQPGVGLRRALTPPRQVRIAVGLVATGVVLAFLFRFINGEQALSAVQVLVGRPDLLAIFFSAYTAAFLLRAIAWRSAMGQVSVGRLFAILQAALLVNHVLPVKAGEALRPYLAVRLGVSAGRATVTTALMRLLDLLCLLVLAGMLLPLSLADGSQGITALALPGSALLGGVVLVLWVRSAPWIGRPPPVLQPFLHSARTALQAVTPRQLALAALFTFPSWALEASALMVAAQALGTEVPVQVAVAVVAFTILFQVFHVTPGGLGVYEASMTGALALYGLPLQEGLVIAVLTHGLKFLYSYTVGVFFAALIAREAWGLRGLDALRGNAMRVKAASRLEIRVARLWNVVNEGKPFTPVFVVGVLLVLSLPHVVDGARWLRFGAALVALTPLFLVFYRFDFPLKLRLALWVYLGLFLALFRYFDPVVIALVLALYIGFTVVLWGTVYYHLRIGTPWTNFTRFWRLVLENPDPTSGNFLEQVPKALLLALLFGYLLNNLSTTAVAQAEAFTLMIGASALLLHQWFFTWPPPVPLTPTRDLNTEGRRHSQRVIVIVIDGCRVDRLQEADTPCIDRLRCEGADIADMRTVYPARTVTCFSSMLTGAPPRVHGMSSNFVPQLGVKCDSLFAALRRQGRKGRLVGIAHLIDAFGEEDVRTVTAITHNDEIDHALAAKGKQVLREEDPDLLVLQLLSVDQTGHARGSYNQEYRRKIEATDRVIEEFLGWCRENGYLDGATVIVTADHGQTIGIGGHGHMSPTEAHIPCILWGAGIPAGLVKREPRSILDIAPTVSYLLGVLPPEQSVGQVLAGPGIDEAPPKKPVVVIIPAHNEEESLPATLAAIPREVVPDLRVIVVDDGSVDGTAGVAEGCGVDLLLRHPRNRGLGAALRTGLEAARRMDARAAVYLDADGQYDPREIPLLLAPIERGEADYVLGARCKGRPGDQAWTRRAGNLLFTTLLGMAAGRRIMDGQAGFRAFSRRALETAEIIHDYNYAQVLTLDLLHKGMRLAEVPITYRPRRHGKSFVRADYLWRVPLGMVREMLHG